VPHTYVALLRGINVGGNNVIAMAALVATFERAKFAAVRTYIQSGNVIFETPERDARALESRIARALTKAHAYDARVVVRHRDEMAAIVADMPRAWKKPVATLRYNVLFLGAELDQPKFVDELARRGLDGLAYRPGVVYWHASADDLGRAALGKVSKERALTVRNLNTTTKIFERM
jgi:uncharacterized protein (DUF1697 family)